MSVQLTLPQALFLLARDDETGRPKGNYNGYIQLGGAIADLVAMGRLSLDEHPKPKVSVENTKLTGDAFLDTVLARIAASQKSRKLNDWVGRLHNMKGRVGLVGKSLEALGAVNAIRRKRLGLFPSTRWVQHDPSIKTALLEDMKHLMFSDAAPIDERTATIIGLANSGHLLKRNFARSALRRRRLQIREIVEANRPTAQASRQAIEAVDASIAAAAAVATVIAAG